MELITGIERSGWQSRSTLHTALRIVLKWASHLMKHNAAIQVLESSLGDYFITSKQGSQNKK